MSAASSQRLLRKVQASARCAAVRPRSAHLRVRLGDLRLALPDWRIYWRAPPLERRKPPELQGLRKLRDRDSNCGQRHAAIPVLAPDLAPVQAKPSIRQSDRVRLNPAKSERDWHEIGTSALPRPRFTGHFGEQADHATAAWVSTARCVR